VVALAENLNSVAAYPVLTIYNCCKYQSWSPHGGTVRCQVGSRDSHGVIFGTGFAGIGDVGRRRTVAKTTGSRLLAFLHQQPSNNARPTSPLLPRLSAISAGVSQNEAGTLRSGTVAKRYCANWTLVVNISLFNLLLYTISL